MGKKKIFCFFGIDGAGKTTIIQEIEKKIREEGYDCKTIYMGRAGNHKLPFIKKIIQIRSNRMLKKRKLSSGSLGIMWKCGCVTLKQKKLQRRK